MYLYLSRKVHRALFHLMILDITKIKVNFFIRF